MTPTGRRYPLPSSVIKSVQCWILPPPKTLIQNHINDTYLVLSQNEYFIISSIEHFVKRCFKNTWPFFNKMRVSLKYTTSTTMYLTSWLTHL